MTRKDFVHAAKVAVNLAHQLAEGTLTITDVFEGMADVCEKASTTTLFKRERFLTYCEEEYLKGI